MWVVALQNLLCRLGLAHVEAHLTMDRNTWRGARVITFAMVHTRYHILGTHLPKPNTSRVPSRSYDCRFGNNR